MEQAIFREILDTVGLFFINPAFLITLISAILVGYFRVKKERSSYRIRMLPGLSEFSLLLKESWLYAIILSILISGIGLVVESSWLLALSLVMTVSILTLNFKLTSPIYMSLLAIGVVFLWQTVSEPIELFGLSIKAFDPLGTVLITITMITGLLVIVEGSLIRKYGHSNLTSYLIKTNRGLQAAVLKSKKLWLLPIVFVVPGDFLQEIFPYWPQITLGSTEFTFLIVPLIIGFSQVIRTRYPDELLPQMGRAIMVIGFVITAAGVAALWMPIVAWGGLLAGLVARIVLAIVTSIQERRKHYLLSPQSKGVVISGIVPDSPGEKMGLRVGEIIRTVNGKTVHTEKELYAAIQINAAHCRLQVIDRDGEVRLMQQVLYHHDHHRLGILVVR